MEIQSVIFDKETFSNQEAKAWLKKYNLKPIKPQHITKNYRRFRIKEPIYNNYVNKKIEEGIKLILGK